MPNRLSQETSPYLLQHQDNPVDWYPWGPEALARARAEDKPILLSIGYSSCHWCHVMAHECFEDPDVASAMNALFINIKVDREERPDLDQLYQNALQLLTRQGGGWPLTMFLMPDQTPFFGGTYFPKTARYNLPGLIDLMQTVAHAYRHRRVDLEANNVTLREALAADASDTPMEGLLEITPAEISVGLIKQGFDPVHGGYGKTPKFPRPPELAFLLHRGDAESRAQVLMTLRHMAEGGLQDHLGGGFYRYSVDERWAIPHFEKMLYDNGQLLGLYADAWAMTGEPVFEQAAAGIVAWLARDMTAPEGAFYAALDADSEHEEGKFYVWTPDAVSALLSADEYAVAALYWGLDGAPNFEGHAWHLCVSMSRQAIATRRDMPETTVSALLERSREKLFTAREMRLRPGLDDKRLVGWNALMIKGLARAGRRFGRPAWTAMAQAAVDALHCHAWRDGRLMATWKDGQARHNGYLDDYAFLLDALLELLQASFRPEDLAWATALADALLNHFEDPENGGFWFTSHDHEALIARTRPAYDNATPSGNGIATLSLARLGHLLGEPRYLAASTRSLHLHYPAMRDHPPAYPSLLTALLEHLNPPRIVVLRGPALALHDWQRAAEPICPADTLMISLPAGLATLPGALDKPVPTHATAYVCAGVNCLPVIVHLNDLLAVFKGEDIH